MTHFGPRHASCCRTQVGFKPISPSKQLGAKRSRTTSRPKPLTIRHGGTADADAPSYSLASDSPPGITKARPLPPPPSREGKQRGFKLSGLWFVLADGWIHSGSPEMNPRTASAPNAIHVSGSGPAAAPCAKSATSTTTTGSFPRRAASNSRPARRKSHVGQKTNRQAEWPSRDWSRLNPTIFWAAPTASLGAIPYPCRPCRSNPTEHETRRARTSATAAPGPRADTAVAGWGLAGVGHPWAHLQTNQTFRLYAARPACPTSPSKPMRMLGWPLRGSDSDKSQSFSWRRAFYRKGLAWVLPRLARLLVLRPSARARAGERRPGHGAAPTGRTLADCAGATCRLVGGLGRRIGTESDRGRHGAGAGPWRGARDPARARRWDMERADWSAHQGAVGGGVPRDLELAKWR